MLVYRGSGDWSAFYVNGHLEAAGDHYWVDEKIFQKFGVAEISSDSFLLGGDEVAKTVEEILDFDRTEQARERQAAELTLQAQELLQKAEELRSGGKV